jgi:hypothetical protein
MERFFLRELNWQVCPMYPAKKQRHELFVLFDLNNKESHVMRRKEILEVVHLERRLRNRKRVIGK